MKNYSILLFVAGACLCAGGAFMSNGATVTAENKGQNYISMETGASVRFGSMSGIRFMAKVNSEYYGANQGAEYGMLFARAEKLNEGTMLTYADVTEEGEVFKNPTKIWAEKKNAEEEKVFYDAIYNIPETVYGTKLIARAYIKNGDTIIYSPTQECRSIAQVASYALKDGNTNETLYNYVDKYLDSVASDFSGEASLKLFEGETKEPRETISMVPEDLTVIWKSQNEQIAAVDKDGIIKGVKTGTTIVTATLGTKVRRFNISVCEPEAEKTSEYQVKNGTFETGDLTGWRYTSGKFGEITDDRLWWNKYPYYNGGKYHFAGTEDEGATGVLQSERFKVKENGIMTFRLGGGKNPNLCYISLRESGSGKELARFGNTLYQDGPSGWEGFDPYNAIGATINLANYVKYIADLKEYAGKEVYIEIVDKASSDWGFLNVDSIITDYDEKPEGDWNPAQDIKPVVQEGSKYQVANGSFESGDLTGWTLTFTDGTSDDLSKAIVFKDTFGWGNYGDGRPVQIAFNKSGRYFFDGGREGLAEACKYTLTSSCFTLGGSGYISFRLGGNGGHVNIRKAGTDEVVAAYYNTAFKDMNFGCIAGGSMQATMTTYVADLRDHINEELYIELVDDNGGNGWNAALLDEVITYYETIPGLSADRVVCYAHSVEGKEEEIPWKYAVNALKSNS